jgi:hypothetical protein
MCTRENTGGDFYVKRCPWDFFRDLDGYPNSFKCYKSTFDFDPDDDHDHCWCEEKQKSYRNLNYLMVGCRE